MNDYTDYPGHVFLKGPIPEEITDTTRRIARIECCYVETYLRLRPILSRLADRQDGAPPIVAVMPGFNGLTAGHVRVWWA